MVSNIDNMKMIFRKSGAIMCKSIVKPPGKFFETIRGPVQIINIGEDGSEETRTMGLIERIFLAVSDTSLVNWFRHLGMKKYCTDGVKVYYSHNISEQMETQMIAMAEKLSQQVANKSRERETKS